MSYNNFMAEAGRPSKNERTPLGERIYRLREDLGLSQQELAEKVGMNQQMIAYWERRAIALKPEQIKALAEVFGVSSDEVLGKETSSRTKKEPVGRLQKVFEQVARLPRRQQAKITEVIEALLAQQQG